jgi:type VI secretion system secreted protein VgrG
MTVDAAVAANTADFTFQVGDLGSDDLRVTGFDGSEGISELFDFRVRLCSKNANIDLDSVLGKPARLEIAAENGPRYVNGIVRRFEMIEDGSSLTHYEANIVPPQWILTRRIRARIYQQPLFDDTSVLGILAAVLNEAGLQDAFSFAISKQYQQRDFTVQYRESDWDFINRLMEEEGIHFLLQQHEDGCNMVITDDNSMHVGASLSGIAEEKVVYRDPNGMIPERDFIFSVRYASQMQIGRVGLDDFNFRDPGRDLATEVEGKRFSNLVLADHPGDYLDRKRGDELAQMRLEEQQCGEYVATMSATVRDFQAGASFTLGDHPNEKFNRDYLITNLTHRATQTQSGEQEAGGSAGTRYQAELRVIPHGDLVYRPARVTPRPTVQGSQTAIVTGPKTEEIHTDEYGRVKVKFHWDQEYDYDENASCWVRVSQGWAGGQYGMMFLPRVGQEVIVDFLEGNPDRPIITGRVYNNDHMPPYKLPDNKTISTIRTCSTKGAKGGNEVRFDDAKGEEQLLLFGEKSLHIRSKGSRYESIGANRHKTVGCNAYEYVKENSHSTVKLDRLEETQGNLHVSVGKDVKISTQGRKTEYVGKKYAILNSEGIVLASDTAITFEVKGNFIKLDASGVTIVGKQVMINSGGVADTWAWDSPDLLELPKAADKIDYGNNTSYAMDAAPPADQTADEETETSWIEIELVDDFGQPVPGETYQVTSPDGKVRSGTLDDKGQARVRVKNAGECQITFPRLDMAVWERE